MSARWATREPLEEHSLLRCLLGGLPLRLPRSMLRSPLRSLLRSLLGCLLGGLLGSQRRSLPMSTLRSLSMTCQGASTLSYLTHPHLVVKGHTLVHQHGSTKNLGEKAPNQLVRCFECQSSQGQVTLVTVKNCFHYPVRHDVGPCTKS